MSFGKVDYDDWPLLFDQQKLQICRQDGNDIIVYEPNHTPNELSMVETNNMPSARLHLYIIH